MGLTTAITTSFKAELLEGIHQCGSDTFRLALFVASPTGVYGPSTTSYEQLGSDELPTGYGYTQGGVVVSNLGVSSYSTQAYTSWGSALWTGATFSTLGAILYNASKSNRAVLIEAFPNLIQVENGSLNIVLPTLTYGAALVNLQ